MDDRKMPQPRSLFREALKGNPHDNAREAETMYDSAGRREILEADKALKEKAAAKPAGTSEDAVATSGGKPLV